MKYFEKIDGLRCIAISAIFIHHFIPGFANFINLGYYGVDLFFVISGFLITLILLNSKGKFKHIFGNFLVRRSLRIFPLYYFVLIFLLIIGNNAVWEHKLSLLTYTFNYSYPFIDVYNPVIHFWSLGVEEQFYLFWPLIVLGFKNKIRVLKIILIMLILFAYLQIYFNIIPSLTPYNYSGLPARMGTLGLGCLGCLLFLEKGKYLDGLLKSTMLEYIMYVVWIVSLMLFDPLIMGVTSLFFVLKAATNSFNSSTVSRVLSHKNSLYIGRISYGLYIYHVPVLYYLSKYIFNSMWPKIDFKSWGVLSVLEFHTWIITLPIYVTMCLIIAHLSFRYFETPFLKIKDKHFKSTMKKHMIGQQIIESKNY